MPESWIKFTQENLSRSMHEREVSAKLRGAVDACIRACANEMWAQHNAVNNALNARVKQLEGAKEALQAHLQRVPSRLDRLIPILSMSVVGPIPWGHSGPLCHALSLLSLSWTSMRRRRATVAACDSSEIW